MVLKMLIVRDIVANSVMPVLTMNRVYVGDIVMHKRLGEGITMETSGKKENVFVEFESGKKMMSYSFVFENGLLTLVKKQQEKTIAEEKFYRYGGNK